MAAADHEITRVTTAQTTTSTSYGNISGASISNTNLTAGTEYLIQVSASIKISSAGQLMGVRVTHGSTPTVFDDSTHEQETNTSDRYYPYHYFTKWTAVSGEDINVQFRTGNVSHTVTADQIVITAIELTNVNYHHNKVTTDDTTSTTWTSGASTSFSVSSDDKILVLARGRYENLSTADNTESRILHGSDVEPEVSVEGENAGEMITHFLMRAYSQTSASGSNTYAFQSRQDAGGASVDRRGSEIIAIELSSFDVAEFSYTDASVVVSATDFATQLESDTITPNTTGDVFAMVYASNEMDTSTTSQFHFRMQKDGTDTPASQTTDKLGYHRRNDVDEIYQATIHDIANVTTSGSTFDFDASKTGTHEGVKARCIVLFTLELASSGATVVSQTSTHLFDILEEVNNISTHRFDILNEISNTFTHRFNILNSISNTFTHRFDILEKISNTFTHRFNILQEISNTSTHIFNILSNLTSVTQTSTHRFNILQEIGNTSTHRFNILGRISNTFTHLFNILSDSSPVSITRNVTVFVNEKRNTSYIHEKDNDLLI